MPPKYFKEIEHLKTIQKLNIEHGPNFCVIPAHFLASEASAGEPGTSRCRTIWVFPARQGGTPQELDGLFHGQPH